MPISPRRPRYALAPMPIISISQTELQAFGQIWTANNGALSRTAPYTSSDLGKLFDMAVGRALGVMLGGIPVEVVRSASLTPPAANCVEVGPVRIIGGVRSQDFDVGYRPDGVRFAFDSKTLNGRKSIGKNWQNMVNDLATEATTVHTRFPHALVAFMFIVPKPVLTLPRERAVINTLERLARRVSVADPDWMAEAMAFVVWNPTDGTIDPEIPEPTSRLRYEHFSAQIQTIYADRYKGLPPHANE